MFSFKIENNNTKYFTYTKAVNEDFIKILPDKFFPSLFQEKIDIELELRTFYLNGIFYTGALFYQTDEENIDWRVKATNNLRILPFNLPKKIENKLDKIAKKLELKTCSFDILLDNNGKFYFLESNPQGQFGFLSKECNYNLEKIFAEFLLNF